MEQLRNEFLAKLQDDGFETEIINKILLCFDCISSGYEVSRKETGIIVANELPEVVKTFIAVKHIEGCSDQTLYNYKLILEGFFRRMQVDADKITTNMIRGYLHEYHQERKVSLSRLNTVQRCIRSFFSWAYSEGYLQSDPGKPLNPIRVEKKQRHALTRVQLEKLRRVCRNDRERAIIDVLYSTGCRVSELIGIKIEDIDFKTGEIMVFGKGRKQRRTYLNAAALLSVRTYIDSRTDGNPYLIVSYRKPSKTITRSSVLKIVKALAKRAAVENVSPHILRHTMATIALQSGMPVQDIQKLLGHENISTTMIYSEVDMSTVRAEHARYVV